MATLDHLIRKLPLLRSTFGFGDGVSPAVIRLAAPPRNPSRDRKYDYAAYPNGWIQIGWSHELCPGQVRPVHCLGRELVMFRGHDSRLRVLDAYCPHLGAHLGVGGSVVGNEIRCPFHGWQFDGTGTCTLIPHARKIPPKAQMTSWLVREKSGLIFIWHDAEGRPPWFEIPDVPEVGSSDWSEPYFVAYEISTRWRELIENAVDRAHLYALHEYPSPPKVQFEATGPHFTVHSEGALQRFGQEIKVALDIEAHGPGMGSIRGHAILPFVLVGCPMPLDEQTVIHRLTIVVSKKIPSPLRQVMGHYLIRNLRSEFEADIRVWESKICATPPLLSEADGPIARYRAWGRQFYRPPGESVPMPPNPQPPPTCPAAQ